jgi:two-component system sensor histidine kinase KdpD
MMAGGMDARGGGRGSKAALGYPAAVLIVGASVAILKAIPNLTDAADALGLILAVFLVAWVWQSGPGIAAAILATAALNFFFFPPLYTFTISDSRNVVALLVFLAAGLAIGRLSALSRLRLRLLEREKGDLLTLTALSQAFLADTNRESLLGVVSERLRRALEAEQVTILLGAGNGAFAAAASSGDGSVRQDLAEIAYRQGNSAAFPSALGGTDVYLPIPLGVQRVGALAARGVRRSERMAEGCAALVGLALEREKFLKVAREVEGALARDEMKSTMLATLGHDLKTPLAAARASAENWERRAGASGESAAVGAALERLTRLVDDLLNVVRLESGTARPSRERVSCGAIAEAAVARFGSALDRHALVVDVEAPDLDVLADPAQMTEAVGMGLENAGRYSPPGSEVRFTVSREGEHALFRVSDAGPGIAPQERERAFEKFTRLPRDPSSPGSGLGLYIARTLTRLNGGTLTLGASPSGGTAFEIRLPAPSRP